MHNFCIRLLVFFRRLIIYAGMKITHYTFKEKLELAESIVTIIMFLMAVWGTLVAFEHSFWTKLDHVVDHYHHEAEKQEKLIQRAENHALEKHKTIHN